MIESAEEAFEVLKDLSLRASRRGLILSWGDIVQFEEKSKKVIN